MPKNIKAPWWDKAIAHLSENDKILKKIISEHKEIYLQYRVCLLYTSQSPRDVEE